LKTEAKPKVKRVLRVERELFAERYPFLMGSEYGPCYPSEILRNSLYLGSAACTKAGVLSVLDITHVVSLVNRALEKPHWSIQHLHCSIPDATDVDLTPSMEDALPFIARAIAEGGRVLVHCERGVSRSASVVTAYLMMRQHSHLPAALAAVRAARPCANPNPGFMAQLKARRWEEDSPSSSERNSKRARSEEEEEEEKGKEGHTRSSAWRL